MSKQLVLLASGTRGDVQPMVALGLGLQQAGYDVSILTHPLFAPLVRAYGLQFVPLHANPNDLFAEPDLQGALTLRNGLVRGVRTSLRYIQRARSVYARMLHEAWLACRHADGLLVSLPTLWGQQIADALGIPCVWTLTQPLTPTRHFVTPFAPLSLPLGGAGNLLSHRLIDASLWLPWRGVLNRWRRDDLHVPPLRHAGPFTAAGQDATVLYGFSPQVVPRPSDWPPRHQIVGPWPLDPPPGWLPPADLASFVQGEPPVVIGFGSMDLPDPTIVARTALEALALAKLRGVLQLPPVPLSVDPRRALLAGPVPHAWLFEQAAAVVHHGGAGTTAAGLRAGVPSVIMPFGIDQFFWARRVVSLGVGVASVGQRSLTAQTLAAALLAAIGDRALRDRAARLGAQIRAEDGIGNAVRAVHRLI